MFISRPKMQSIDAKDTGWLYKKVASQSAEHEDTTEYFPAMEEIDPGVNGLRFVSFSDNRILEHEKATNVKNSNFNDKNIKNEFKKERKSSKKKNQKMKSCGGQSTEKKTNAPYKESREESFSPRTQNHKDSPNNRTVKANQHIGGGGGGSSSDSEEEDNRRRIPGGHYAGLPSNNDVSMKSDSEKTYTEQQDNCPLKDVTNQLDDSEVKERYIDRLIKKLNCNIDDRKIASVIARNVVHCAYNSTCSKCDNEEKICRLVRKSLQHLEMQCKNEDNCKICRMTNIGVSMHAMKCSEENCPVPRCSYFRKDFESRNHRRKINSIVLHSTTTLFRIGDQLKQDRDYGFLYEQRVGKGTYGVVDRALFFSFRKEVEADIIVKKAKYDVHKEARLYHVLREDHPNVMVAMAVIQFQNPLDGFKGYLLMERADTTLFELRCKYENSCFPAMDALYYFVQIIDGLKYLHSKGIVHRDIKDKNILVTQNGQRAKIADFDAAEFLEDEMLASRSPVGTCGFAAPEVLNRQPHSTPADIFSSGVTMLNLMFGNQYWKRELGKKPNGAPELEATHIYYKRRKDSMDILEKEQPEIYKAVESCLLEDPKQRPTAKELYSYLMQLLDAEFKVQLPKAHDEVESEGRAIDMKYLDDIKGELGDRAREMAEEIQNANSESIAAILDQLPKVLPSENIPGSNDWAQNIQPVAEAMEIG